MENTVEFPEAVPSIVSMPLDAVVAIRAGPQAVPKLQGDDEVGG